MYSSVSVYVNLCVCRKSVVVGAGYIAVELAGILSALGSDVSLLIRYDKARVLFVHFLHLFSCLITVHEVI